MREEQNGSGGRGGIARGSGSKRIIFRRTVFLMAVCGVLLFVPLFWRLWDISVVQHEHYQQLATGQQTLDLAVSANRGNIYDCNGNVMAMSATVYTLVVSPNDLAKSVKATDYTDQEGDPDQEARAAAVAAKQGRLVEDLMALVPGLDRERITTQIQATKYSYRELKTNIEEEEAEAIRAYIVENKTSSYLYLISGTKRYYPYSGLAAQALGFVNAEGGAVGIEAEYDDVLEGTAGRVVTTRTAAGTEMYNSYSQFVDAIDGYDLTLTIDATIQSYAEKAVEKGIEAFDVQNGAMCIAMDPKTGAIRAIASSPDFDPNNYSKILDSRLSQRMGEDVQRIYAQLKADNPNGLSDSELMEQAEAQAYSDAVNTQWRSKALDSRYEPGSTFKAMVVAAALEEGLISERDTFVCSGAYTIQGWEKPIHCHKKTGHGVQTLAEAVQNSCNPALMQIGQKMGIDRFYDYFEAFGMKERTGVDLPGEASLDQAVWEREEMTGVDLAVASFGQRFEVTPLQMITAFSAVINGGNLLKPYVVQSVTAPDGAVVQNTEPTVVRQVVSRETSQRAVAILESVVERGSGKNAYVAGYHIGGKTGTAETKVDGEVIVSFIGFAPADDPEIVVLLAYDRPKRAEPGSSYSTTGVYISGGNMAAKDGGPLIAEILDYMGVEKEYSAEELAAADVPVPEVAGLTLAEAEKAMEEAKLSFRTVGEGETVAHQVPAAGASIPGKSTVVLYLGQAAPEESGVVPEVAGLTYEEAQQRLERAGFFMRASGVPVYYTNTTTAEGQSIAGGETAAIGTVINVQFTNLVEDGWVDLG